MLDNPQLTLPDKYKGQPNEEELKQKHREMLFEPGEAIGVVAAQSISEPATQMTMETYHSAGAAKVSITQGLPRLIEVINARRNPKTPVMNIYLEEDSNSKEDARDVAATIKEVKLDDVVSEDTLDLAQLQLSFTLDKGLLDEYRMDVEDVVAKLKDKLSANVDVDGNELTVYPTDDDYDLTDLQDMKAKAMDYRLHGFKRIEDVVILEEDGEWRVQTAGINMRKILRLDKVDETRTRCNDLYKFEKVFGIEGVRNLILDEMQNTLDEQGMVVNDRWLMLIADAMTKDGEVNGATRYGICGNKDSVLARSAFEETKKHLKMAAVHGERDPLNSVVENIIVGQLIPVGTGNLELAPKAAEAPDSVIESIRKKRQELKEEKEQKMEERRREAEEAAGDDEEGTGEAAADSEDLDYTELAHKNIAEIKDFVAEAEDVDLERLLEAEEADKDRKTMKQWINEQMDGSED